MRFIAFWFSRVEYSPVLLLVDSESSFLSRRRSNALSSCELSRLGINLSLYTTGLRGGEENRRGGELREDAGDDMLDRRVGELALLFSPESLNIYSYAYTCFDSCVNINEVMEWGYI
mmetsp:Transcript_7/g.16  ORF Transcript_7/g.16 Transcript_7/m.16 type:complete len:117 (+) Transcript_7:641-991(+)